MKDKVIQIVYTFSCMFLALFFVVISSTTIVNVMRTYSSNQQVIAWSHQETYAMFLWFGVLSLWFAIAAEKRAQHRVHPTGGESTVKAVSPESAPLPSNQVTPPTSG